MIKFITLAILAMFVISCTPIKDNKKLKKPLNLKGQEFGQKITLKKVTKISEIMKIPKTFVNKKVLVKGTVTSVCARRGCWMELVGEGVGERIRIKVRDGKIVFPMTAKGKDAAVEGTVYAINIKSRKPACNHKHKAGEDHEGSSCQQKVAPGVETIYQIKGISAVILD